jgi:hypothetical protein
MEFDPGARVEKHRLSIKAGNGGNETFPPL